MANSDRHRNGEPPVPTWPRIEATITEHGNAEVTIAGVTRYLDAANTAEARRLVLELITATATELGRAVRSLTHDPAGDWPLIIHPDGTVAADPTTKPQPRTQPAPPIPKAATGTAHTPGAATAPAPPPRIGEPRPPRASGRRWPRMTLGTRTAAGAAAALDAQNDLQAVSQTWPRPRTVAVITVDARPATLMTAAALATVFARHGGPSVLALNSAASAAVRPRVSEHGLHQGTLRDLLPHDPARRGGGDYRAGLGKDDITAVLAAAAGHYRLIIIDCGSDETNPVTRCMIDRADHLVVAASDDDDDSLHLLHGLTRRSLHCALLAEHATRITHIPKTPAQDCTTAGRTHTIGYDPAVAADILTYDALQRSTQHAWTAAAAAVARGL